MAERRPRCVLVRTWDIYVLLIQQISYKFRHIETAVLAVRVSHIRSGSMHTLAFSVCHLSPGQVAQLLERFTGDEEVCEFDSDAMICDD